MPDVCRSDSQRSDSSQRPRVSFNRDVHVKRISSAGAPRIVGALSGDGAGRVVPLPVRRQRPSRLSRQELAREARRVLEQADRVTCLASVDGFSSLRLPRRSRKQLEASLNGKHSSSLTDLSSPERPKRRKGLLKRSQSERSSERPPPRQPKSESNSFFHSLERKRLKSRQPDAKYKNHHSDNSDRSPSPPARLRKNILKKSLSDSETPRGTDLSKKQLSPIIEDVPRDDYFAQNDDDALKVPDETKMHSSQLPASKPSLTRGRTVESMVKRLSQDAKRPPRKAPRGVSPSALLTPGDDRHHNNNLPFSYTEPTPLPTATDRFATPTDGQVIYAEVVVSGGGTGQVNKQTVHRKVSPENKQEPLPSPTRLKQDSNVQASDEDEGVSLTMDYGRKGVARRDYVNRQYADSAYKNGALIDVKTKTNDGRETALGSKVRRDLKMEYSNGVDGSYRREVVQESSRYHSGEFSLDSSARGRADGMDSRRKDYMIENSGAFDDHSYRHGNDIFDSLPRKNTSNDFINGEKYKSESRFYRESFDSGGYNRRDSTDSGSPTRREPPIQPRIIDSNDLSSRRDRLESKIESQRKDRFVTSRLQETSGFNNSLLSDSNKKFSADLRNTSDSNYNRREFLNSQIDYGTDNKREEKYENDRNHVKSSRYVETRSFEIDNHGKKDFFADSGIEVDYRKESGGNKSSRRYEDVKTIDGPTAKIIISSREPPTNISRIDLNGRRGGRGLSDDDDEEDDDFRYKSTGTGFNSTRLVQEHRKTTDVLPASTVLIRHYAPTDEREASPVYRSRAQRESDKFIRVERGEATDEEFESRRRDHKKSSNRKRDPSDDRETETEVQPGDTLKKSGTLKESEKKQEKKKESKKKQGSAMDKVKQLFSRSESSKKDKKKKKDEVAKEDVEQEDPLATRYTEYKGSNVESDQETLRATPRSMRRFADVEEIQAPMQRQRLATPSPSLPRTTPTSSATLTRINNSRNKENSSWFKSLDRLTKKNKVKQKSDVETDVITEDEVSPPYKSSYGNKNLRFFGDTDAESVISIPPPPAPISRRYKTNSALNGSSNKLQVPRNTTGLSKTQKRHHRSAGDVATSSAESTTEGDSSQQSQRSVVYLHAATVGDIPGPPNSRSQQSVGRRAQSREELSSITSSHLQPQTKTISRSISVLAPWKPRHYKEGLEVHYTNEDNNRNYIKNGKPPKVPVSHQSSLNSTINRGTNRRKYNENGKTFQQKQKVNKAISVESLSHKNSPSGGVRQTLEMRNSAKKRALNSAASTESLSQRSNFSSSQHKNRDRIATKKNSALNASAIELSSNSKNFKTSTPKNESSSNKSSSKVSRSASMPKDTRVTAGWFKMRTKKQGAN